MPRQKIARAVGLYLAQLEADDDATVDRQLGTSAIVRAGDWSDRPPCRKNQINILRDTPLEATVGLKENS